VRADRGYLYDVMRRLLVVLASSLALAPAAHAAPPVVGSVGLTDTRATVTWTLPNGGQDWTVEIASAAAVGPDGGFLTANIVDLETFLPGTTVTTWTSSVPLDAGTYYVHVAASDISCSTCASYEWSAVKTLVVAGTTSAGSSPPAATTPAVTLPPVATTPTVTAAATTTVTQPSANARASVTRITTARAAGVETVTVRACGPGSAKLRVVQTLTRGGKAAATATSIYTIVTPDGCGTYRLSWRIPAKLAGTGAYAVAVTIAE
jgi:hypothetical protein